MGGCEPVQSGRKRSPGVRVSVHCVITVGAVRSRRGVNARVDQDGGDGVNECVCVCDEQSVIRRLAKASHQQLFDKEGGSLTRNPSSRWVKSVS